MGLVTAQFFFSGLCLFQQLIMSQTTVGQRHRDHVTPNSSFRVETNSALETYFFGRDREGKLSGEKFLEFQVSFATSCIFEQQELTSLHGENYYSYANYIYTIIAVS